MPGSLRLIAENVRLQLWLIPMIAAFMAAAIAASVVFLEHNGLLTIPIDIDPSAAHGVLSAISSAMITFTALVFSVTMLVLQQASSQLSPRVTRTFLRDRFNQSILGLFVATFVFSLVILVATSAEFVPQLGVAMALLLVLAAVLGFVVYLDHIANAIRASTVIEAICDETTAVISRVCADEDELAASTAELASLPAITESVRSPHRSGNVVSIDEAGLLAATSDAGDIIELFVAPGDYVVKGEPLLGLRGVGHDPEAASAAIVTARDRSMTQDPLFGFRQLVDIALRALSPGINDPATAAQVVERLHVLLRQLMPLSLEARTVIREEHAIRVVMPRPDWEAYVRSAVDEISEASAGHGLVTEALRTMLRALLADARPDQAEVLQAALTRVGRENASMEESSHD